MSAATNPVNLERWAISMDDDELFAFIRGRIKTKKVIAAVEELIRRYNKNELYCDVVGDDMSLDVIWQ